MRTLRFDRRCDSRSFSPLSGKRPLYLSAEADESSQTLTFRLDGEGLTGLPLRENMLYAAHSFPARPTATRRYLAPGTLLKDCSREKDSHEVLSVQGKLLQSVR